MRYHGLFTKCFPSVAPIAMSNKIKFTDLIIKNLTPEIGIRINKSDLECPGLNLRITENGVKTFSFAYRIGRKVGRSTIGRYPIVSLKEAREKANSLRKLVFDGIDPRLKRIEEKQKLDFTVNKMINEFIERYAKPRNSSWAQAERLLSIHLGNMYGSFGVHEITKKDIHLILDKLSSKGTHVTGNRVLAHMKRFFSWLVERGYIEQSPADHIRPRHIEKPRERVLNDREIHLIFLASNQLSQGYDSWVKLLFLCGQRETETARIRKSQIEDQTWILSSSDTKNNKANAVPLSTTAWELISKLKETDNDFLLTSGRIGDNPINGFSKVKRKIDKITGISDWTWHDIRAAVATNLAKLGYDRSIVRRVLNHKDTGVTAVYDRYSYLNEKRIALEEWNKRLNEITGQTS